MWNKNNDKYLREQYFIMGILDKVKNLGKKGIEKGTELGVKGLHEAKESAKKGYEKAKKDIEDKKE